MSNPRDQQHLSIVSSFDKTGAHGNTVGQDLPLQYPLNETAAELAWGDVTDFDFTQRNLPVTGGSYSVGNTADSNNLVNVQGTAVTILYIAGAVVGFLLLIKVLKKLAII